MPMPAAASGRVMNVVFKRGGEISRWRPIRGMWSYWGAGRAVPVPRVDLMTRRLIDGLRGYGPWKALQAGPNVEITGQHLPHISNGTWGTIHSQMGSTATGGSEAIIRPAERQAYDLLRAAWHRLPDDKGFTIPVDPFVIAARFGIKVVHHPLDPDMSGMLVKRPTEDPLIYINASDSEVRRRFTCAHELGHYVARTTGRSDDSFGYIDRRGPSAAHGTDPSEIYADEFAARIAYASRERLRPRT